MPNQSTGERMTLTINPPPPTPIEPVTDVLHGIAVTDPYRWLEDQNSPRTRNWLKEQAAYTRAYLDGIPCRHRIRKRVEELLSVEVISELRKVGNRYFYLKRLPYQEQPVIMIREGDSGVERVLVDPAKRGGSSATTVTIMSVSTDANFLAYGISNGADSSRTIEFLDVDRQQILPDHLPRSFDVQLQFSQNMRGFYYSHQPVDSTHPYYRAIYWHEFGTKPEKDLEIFFAGEDRDIHLSLLGSTNGHLLGYLVSRVQDCLAFDFYIHD